MQGARADAQGYSVFILQQRGGVRQWQVCLFFAGIFGQNAKKPRRAGALRGKKCVIILYLFALVVGVLDLERNCHVALLGVALNNNTNVRPIAILADVNIRTGIDPL